MVLGHHGGDAREHAGLIFDGEPDIVARTDMLRRREPLLLTRRRDPFANKVRALAVFDQRHGVGDIADDGTGRGVLAGATSAVERGADDVARDRDRVEHPADVGDDVALGEQGRMDAHAEFVFREVARDDREKLDPEAECGRILEIGRRDARDALDDHLVGLHPDAVREPSEDAGLVGGVPPVDVEGLVGLGVTEAFRIGKHASVRRVAILHLREDVVTRAVQYAVDSRKTICDQAFAKSFDNRDTAGDGRFEEKVAAVLASGREDFRPVFADQRLVGGDDNFPPAKRGEGDLARERGAAHEFAHHVDRGIVGDGERVRGELGRRDFDRAGFAEVADRGAGEVELHAEARLKFGAIRREVFPNALPHGAEATEADVDRSRCWCAHEWDASVFSWPTLLSVPARMRARLAR